MSRAGRQRAPKLLLLSVLLTIGLYSLPFGRELAYPLVLLSTLAHELGHGLGALISGGGFERLVLYSNGAGVALTSASGTLSRVITLSGGLLGPACLAALGFRMSRSGASAKRALSVGAVVFALCGALFVRNLFGLLFVAALVSLLWALARRAQVALCQLAMIFLSTQLALSVFSRADYLFTPVAELGGGRVMPSDVGQLEELLWLPYWLWGALIGLTSLLVLYWGVQSALPQLERRAEPEH